MRFLSRVGLMWAACALVAACNSEGLSENAGETESVRMEISLAGDVCGVVSADAVVSGLGMSVIGPVPLQVDGTAIRGQVSEVPAGTGRAVRVIAYNASMLEVYAGSAVVDVVAGEVVSASLVLHRNPVNCPGTTTGGIDISGRLETGEPTPDGGSDGGVDPDAGVVLGGAEFAFSYQDATLTSDGVIHFLDGNADRIRRLDLTTRSFLSAYVGTGDATSMAVASDGQTAYLAYTGGRIDAFTSTEDGTARFFAAAPASVSRMVVADRYLFTIDGSGAWGTHALYQRATGARVAAADWRSSAVSLLFSEANNTIYFADSGVSPQDLNRVQVDMEAGTLGAEIDSPYHGAYNLRAPLRLWPDGSAVVTGSGLLFNAADLTYRTSIGLSFVDIAFHGERLYLIDTVGDRTQLRVLNHRFDILSAAYYPGAAQRVFVHNGQLVLLTSTGSNGFQARLLDL
ncbi:hypothetical protein [Myxococcus virescens]|uniref:Lipoprotein n=2 Tax=Myxococcus virescens TaxID=83456 RepID=A0ABY0MZ85_9BACT|nr:hypothetical protein [Myxococcus virescens]SDE71424.1 hypothetical protein SAMN04488504_110139 [Myxococcus virescens]